MIAPEEAWRRIAERVRPRPPVACPRALARGRVLANAVEARVDVPPFDASAILGCAVFTAYGAVRRGAGLRAGESVAVVATGGVGSNVIQLARAFGAHPIVAIDVRDDKLDAALGLGATHAINGATDDVGARVRELTDGRGVDVAFEALGRPETFVQETNIAGLVAEIRRNLGDPAATPRFIRTVHRIGYRFVGEVTVEDGAPSGERSKFYLVMDARRFFLMDGHNVIGRAPEAAVQIDSPGVSRLHARIRIENGAATLEDLGSKNGTHLNGVRMESASRLADGDEIRLGTIVLTFRAAATDATETVGPD